MMSAPDPESRWSRIGKAKEQWRREELCSLTLERACEEFAEALDRAEALTEAAAEAGLPPMPQTVPPLPISLARLSRRSPR